jgi:hypothetical protein
MAWPMRPVPPVRRRVWGGGGIDLLSGGLIEFWSAGEKRC